ncbi:hypothetical protein [Agrococcus versicolor]|uniref:hypothetical protein n=1 Tax=Agrococcus versicolor TaxID=501482 RepID=UPI0031D40568
MLRFLDPLGRRDSAGREIPHEFVIFDPIDAPIETLDEGIARVWPMVADEYAAIWDRPRPMRSSTDS